MKSILLSLLVAVATTEIHAAECIDLSGCYRADVSGDLSAAETISVSQQGCEQIEYVSGLVAMWKSKAKLLPGSKINERSAGVGIVVPDDRDASGDYTRYQSELTAQGEVADLEKDTPPYGTSKVRRVTSLVRAGGQACGTTVSGTDEYLVITVLPSEGGQGSCTKYKKSVTEKMCYFNRPYFGLYERNPIAKCSGKLDVPKSMNDRPQFLPVKTGKFSFQGLLLRPQQQNTEMAMYSKHSDGSSEVQIASWRVTTELDETGRIVMTMSQKSHPNPQGAEIKGYISAVGEDLYYTGDGRSNYSDEDYYDVKCKLE